jgi:hypothetical protein
LANGFWKLNCIFTAVETVSDGLFNKSDYENLNYPKGFAFGSEPPVAGDNPYPFTSWLT